ncbi:MAG TPA: hypothetical protein VMB71_16540 [Acetobacteraceae bacterium]|nr:hypothetical protein [Acetobacteraceae bacterium]
MVTVREAVRPLALDRGAAQPAAAIFLHAGWRSCGTWLWETLRESENVRAYYEPLHEDLARLDRAALIRFSPASWESGHSPGAPYFAEFVARLRRDGVGIAGYTNRFAFDNFFANEDASDEQLEAYLHGLMAAAHAEGRVPVLKFCRSLGRVPWLVRRFPDACHAVVLRDPVTQWLSARRQMEQAKNRYFVLAPFIILARNENDPALCDIVTRLRVPMPPRLSRDLGITTQVCWRHVQKLTWAERYRGFLALWVASALAALKADATIIDADRLGVDPAHRFVVEQELGRAACLPLSLAPGHLQPAATWRGTDAEADDMSRAAHAALDIVFAARHTLPPARTRLLVRKLTPPFTHGPRAPLPLPGRSLPEPVRRLDAAAYVALARITYPLRRTHYYVRRWLRKA